ncbi:MAG TPA: peptide deformylase [Candidatus Paceibacterota bacterium]|jgi:peptide deformylase|nr:peptide deformylase [Candidatus Paceibacterota bacterium]HPI24340.1 peptide deformylase [Candidatus Paceibacterota bacterium]HPN89456.1 peptide deformylase [Candidatus Paceibacterota bacterium]HQF40794.1 peptide deformylase [Candidatus Paceibacterota bacterium]HQI25731.1 peptide deformylase [Candidatus Paceibacterota bacterium]
MKIVQKDDPVLRQKAQEIPLEKIGSPEIKKIIKQMSEALVKEDDGVALAAPQIGKSLRLFIISGKLFQKENDKEKPADLVFINPKIKKLSQRKQKLEEGCLSVRWLYGLVSRADKATVEAYNETGQKFSRSGSGLMAQIFQHEMDHLDGTLFVDKAKNLQRIEPEKMRHGNRI